MLTAVIMQPTYLPWMGYFDLMDQSDYFVFLDSVQFEKRSWQQRNKIKTPKGELLLTVPVLSKGRFKQKINDVKIDKTVRFEKKHLKAIKHNYHKAKFFKRYIADLENILCQNHSYLVNLNIELIFWLKEVIGINSKLIRSSSLRTKGKRAELLTVICNTLRVQRYLSPIGSQLYLKESNAFKDRGVKLDYHNFKHPQYYQLYGDFIPYLSVIDLLFNEGNKSLSIIRSGRRRG